MKDASEHLNVIGKIDCISIKHGTKRGNPKTFDSLGYTYDLRGVNGDIVHWQCVYRTGSHCCRGVLSQVGNEFTLRNAHLEDYPHNFRKKEYKEFTKEFIAQGWPMVIEVEYLRSLQINKLNRNNTDGFYTPTKSHSPSPVNSASKKRKIDAEIDEDTNTYIIYKPDTTFQKLIDPKNYFCYKLVKASDKSKLWICIKSKGQKCKAMIRQVEDYFSLPKPKHCHPISSQDKASALQKIRGSSSKTM